MGAPEDVTVADTPPIAISETDQRHLEELLKQVRAIQFVLLLVAGVCVAAALLETRHDLVRALEDAQAFEKKVRLDPSALIHAIEKHVEPAMKQRNLNPTHRTLTWLDGNGSRIVTKLSPYYWASESALHKGRMVSNGAGLNQLTTLDSLITLWDGGKAVAVVDSVPVGMTLNCSDRSSLKLESSNWGGDFNVMEIQLQLATETSNTASLSMDDFQGQMSTMTMRRCFSVNEVRVEPLPVNALGIVAEAFGLPFNGRYGRFAQSFPELNRHVPRSLRNEDLPTVVEYLNTQAGAEGHNMEAFGAKLPASVLLVYGWIPILLLQLYQLAAVRELRIRVRSAPANVSVPSTFVALYHDPPSQRIAAILFFVLPPLATLLSAYALTRRQAVMPVVASLAVLGVSWLILGTTREVRAHLNGRFH